MKRVSGIFIFISMLAVFNQGLAQSTNVTLRLKWWHQFQFAGYYAAQVKGFYKKEGLNVNIIPGDATHAVVDEVLSGNADFSITSSDLIVDFANGKPVVALGAIFQHSPYIIISLPEKKIQSPSDLVGKTVMASEDQGWTELKAVLLKEGIDLKSIRIVDHTWNNTDLIKGKADAMTAYRSVELYQLQQQGLKPSYLMPINYGIDFYGDVLFTSAKYAKQHAETVQQFRRASFLGWEYAMSHKEEIADYILTLPGVKERGVTKTALLAEAQEMDPLILPQLVEIGHMNEGRWQHIYNINKQLGLVQDKTDISEFIYTPPTTLSTALKSISIYVVAAVAFVFIAVIFYGFVVGRAVKRRTKELEHEMNVRRKAEAELQKNEALLNTMINSMNEGVALSTLDGQLLIYNKALEKMLGKPPVDSKEKDWSTIYGFCYVDTRQPVPKEKLPLVRALNGESSFDEEYVVIREGREDVYIVCSGIPILDRQQNVIAGMTVKYDVTEERKVSAQKRGAEERYRTLVEQASDAIVIGDTSGNFIEANSAAFKLFGYSKEEFIKLSIRDVLVLQDNDPPLKFKEIMEGKTTISQRTAKRKDGSVFILELNSKLLVDNNILSFGRDITEQKQAEEQLRRHEQQLDLIYNKVADSIFVLNVLPGEQYLFSSVNQSFLQTTGLSFEQVINKKVSDVIPQPSLDMVLKKYREAIEAKSKVEWEEVTPYPTGFKTGIVSVTPVFDNAGNCLQLIGSVHDITETKYAQDELIKMNERYQYVTNATFDAIWDWDMKTNKLYWGGTFEFLFGHKVNHDKDTIANSFDNIHPEDKQRVVQGLNEIIKTKKLNWQDEYRYRKADGSYAYVNDSGILIRNEAGEAYRMIGAMHDITQRKEEELQLKSLESEKDKIAYEREMLINELIKNNKELKQFSFITSHNLRAPLTNLIAISDMIESNKIEDAGTRELIEGFRTSTFKLNETLNDLIKILIIKDSSNQLLEPVYFKEVSGEVIASIQSILDKSGAVIVTDFKKADHVLYNRLYMESIFLNMLTNSIKYAKPNTVPEINIYSSMKNGLVQLVFKDNGIGFDMKTAKERIFGLYQKFHDHPDSKGIGLYLVHSQVTSLGGTIETDSKVGEGTTFTITFKA
jgi:PAS domain S-box-containing protein